MLKFVIGLGINSVPGSAIERALFKSNYVLEDFEIVPIRESDYKLSRLEEIQKRAVDAAEHARHVFPAEAYFGVTSGQSIFVASKEPGALRGLARSDIVAAIVGATSPQPQFLDPAEIHWQLKHRVCSLASRVTSAMDLAKFIRQHCGQKSLPPPR